MCVGDRTISDAAELAALAAESCNEIAGDLIISSIAHSNLGGLECIRSIGGNLLISGNPVLERIGDPALQDGLFRLEAIGESLDIRDNAALESLGLEALTTVGGDFSVLHNPNVSNCEVRDIFDDLVSFFGIVCIMGNIADCLDDPFGCF